MTDLDKLKSYFASWKEKRSRASKSIRGVMFPGDPDYVWDCFAANESNKLVEIAEEVTRALDLMPCLQEINLGVHCRPNYSDKCIRCEAITRAAAKIGDVK